MQSPPEMQPPPGLLEWAADVMGAQTDAAEATLRATPLTGGSTCAVWRFDARTDAGPLVVVAKQARAELAEEGARLVQAEARVLEALQPRRLPVPELLASDPHGICSGAPAMLITHMPGSLLQGEAALRDALGAFAEAIVSWQERCSDLLAGRRFAPWFDPDTLEQTDDAGDATLWRRARDAVQRFPAPVADGFIHRDPHPANLLFDRGAVSAVLDWPNAGRGPRAMDVARMALNLACLLDVDAVTTFREHHEHRSGRRHDPLLDLYALLECDFVGTRAPEATWEALGITLSPSTLRERLDAFCEDTLRRMTVRRLK